MHTLRSTRFASALVGALALGACSGPHAPSDASDDDAPESATGTADAQLPDSARTPDATPTDAPSPDVTMVDAALPDVLVPPVDSAVDVLSADVRTDAAVDASVVDVAATDTSTTDVLVRDAGASADAASCAFAYAFKFGTQGGFVLSTTENSLLPPRTDVVTRRFSTMSTMCTTQLAVCSGDGDAGSAVGVDDVNAAMANADVVAALARGNVLFGRDNRAGDGTVFVITVDDRHSITLGDPCGGARIVCTDPPAGVVALRTLLEALATQERTRGDCGTTL